MVSRGRLELPTSGL